MFSSNYNNVLVMFSFIVAMLASYTALDMAGRVATTQGKASRLWLTGGAIAMGIGVWSMHFIGMLAFNSAVSMGYDPLITLLSMLIAIISSAFALWLVCLPQLPMMRLLAGSLLMGGGIAAMHYTGMAAMRMMPPVIYSVPWVMVSVLVAVVASGAALWMAFHLRQQSPNVRLLRISAAVIMGTAIVGMHYTGMAAATFPPMSHSMAANSGVDNNWLALLVIVVTLAILAITLIISVLDGRMQARTSVLASSLAQANRELTQLALHDNLTKLPNRLLLEDRLGQAVQKATRGESEFAVLFIDLDGFKAVNDAFGHHIGDQLLVSVTERLLSHLRASDTLARLGGDEFVLLTEITEPTDASQLADKLVHLIARPFHVSRYELLVSASIGIAVYPGDGENERELMLNADAAMYHTKNSGRNGHSFFQPSMNANAQNQLQMLNDLRLAIEHHELRLHYQPKFIAPYGPVSGFEALLRWEREGKTLSPDVFLPLAEKTGLIIPIGEWVLNEACRQLREWHLAGHTTWTVAVNLSALQFEQANLVEMVIDTVERHHIPPEMLTLEVTETTAMRNPDVSVAILERLTKYGVKASIDDFGTGYSSLLYLKRLPASELKIDGAFINDLIAGSEDASIVSAIIALGQTLNLKVVAEGVETTQQQDFLTQLGCDTLQGYLLGRPMTPEQIARHPDSAWEPQLTITQQP
ncbi:EAL domain-containing protein [Rahnella sp. FC061912-K]|uniref:putative bifunctional diguanylate cyclase/phosphodiesterase n=1 Tax=Rahnella rivi TaxID=2816249 RepID=UPI001C27F21E|nr:bifunctional diguanylate cyclase/phosphodiesterase [Rahnella rivi]MBU9831996.1 EAL domain-containing protein [Rahnella rivi]